MLAGKVTPVQHARRNHQGIGNKLIVPPDFLPRAGRIRCQSNLAGRSTTTIARSHEAPFHEFSQLRLIYS